MEAWSKARLCGSDQPQEPGAQATAAPVSSLPFSALIFCLHPLGFLLNREKRGGGGGGKLCLSAPGRSRQDQGVPKFIVKVITVSMI